MQERKTRVRRWQQPKTSLLIAGAATATLVAGFALAQAQPSKAEQMTKYRQSGYTLINHNMAPLGMMVQGKAPFDAKAFERHAARIAVLAPMMLEGFPADVRPTGNSKAKPAIWSNTADFQKKMGDFERASVKLADVAKGGDLNAIKPAFGAMAGTCKACHDEYKDK